MSRVLLINTNTMQPPVAPIGLDYVGSALQAAGIEVAMFDLAFIAPGRIEIELIRMADLYTPDVIGLTVRNTDDCCMATRDFFLSRMSLWVGHLKRHCEVPVVVGGVGFSVMPREAFTFLNADYGLAGDGEETFPRLVEALVSRQEVHELPGLLWKKPGSEITFNPPAPADPSKWPLPSRRIVDNSRYTREGGMVGIETKRGCPSGCIYCADPLAKGKRTRVRPPAVVVEEMRDLLAQGANVYHTCDSEFNVPPEHGRAVCEAIIAAGLADRIRWYAYCSPAPFDEATAQLYRRAGCRGINFGCDSGDDGMLERYGRAHRRADILAAVAATKSAGMSCMIDMLLGGPAESPASIRRTLELGRTSGADRVGLAVGVRVYPGTLFARMYLDDMSARPGEALTTATQPDLLQPYFWIEPSLGYAVHDILREEAANDPRFFFMDPARTVANYNYNGNSTLVQAIRKGYRGAFWDILRRVAENIPPE